MKCAKVAGTELLTLASLFCSCEKAKPPATQQLVMQQLAVPQEEEQDRVGQRLKELKSADAKVRVEAVHILGQLASQMTKEQVAQALPVLLKALKEDKHGMVRVYVAEVLGPLVPQMTKGEVKSAIPAVEAIQKCMNWTFWGETVGHVRSTLSALKKRKAELEKEERKK